MDQVDQFFILDDVAFSKQSWQQRNRIRARDGLLFLTVPVRTAGRLGQRILDAEVSDVAFVPKMLKTLAANYGRAPYFQQYFPGFEQMFRDAAGKGNLCELNCVIIKWLASALGIDTPVRRSSELALEGRRGAYVAQLCASVNGTEYVSPAGAEGYLLEDHEAFDSRNIAIRLQVYEHPIYRQCFEPFHPYASVLDLLLNEGDRAPAIMRSGRRPPRALRQLDHTDSPVHQP